MNITTEFALNEMVRLTVSKKGDFIGEIIRIEIDKELFVTYFINVEFNTSEGKYCRIYQRSVNEIRHIGEDSICLMRCDCCGEVKPVVFEKYCGDCLTIVLQSKSNYIKELRKEIQDNKRRILSGKLNDKFVIDSVFEQTFWLMSEIEKIKIEIERLREII